MAMKPTAPEAHRRRRRRSGPRWILSLFALLIFVLILRHEVPQVSAWWESLIYPKEHAARETCISTALHGARRPESARVVDRGEVHATQAGYYVESVLLGEMGTEGYEVLYRISCYVESGGKLVRATRDPVAKRRAEGEPLPLQ
jgi:hypothetical protein